MEFTSFSFVIGFQELALIYVAFLGVFVEAGRVMEETMSVEKGLDGYSPAMKPSVIILLLISSIVVVSGLVVSFWLLLANMDRIPASKSAIFLLYNSVLLAETFFISNLITGIILTVFELDIEKIKELSTKERIKHLRDQML